MSQLDMPTTSWRRFPSNRLQACGHMSAYLPKAGSKVVTYAYPQNEVLDFTLSGSQLRIVGDYYEGEVLATAGHSPD